MYLHSPSHSLAFITYRHASFAQYFKMGGWRYSEVMKPIFKAFSNCWSIKQHRSRRREQMMPRGVPTSLAMKYITSVKRVHTCHYESSNRGTAALSQQLKFEIWITPVLMVNLPRNGSIAFLLHPFLAVGRKGSLFGTAPELCVSI